MINSTEGRNRERTIEPAARTGGSVFHARKSGTLRGSTGAKLEPDTTTIHLIL